MFAATNRLLFSRLAKTILLILASLFIVFSPAAAHRKGDPEDVLEMGVFPFLSANRMEKIFSPIASELEKKVPFEVRYRSTVDFKTYMNRLNEQWYDIAFVQPFDYVRIAEPAGYQPLVAPKIKLRSLFIVKSESPLKTLVELRGKRLALPPEVSAINILAQAKLAKEGINPNNDLLMKNTKNHDACIQALLIDQVDACALAPNPLKLFQSRSKQKLRVIAESEIIPAPLFVVHSRIPKNIREELRTRLMDLKLPETAMKLWGKKADWARPVASSDYNLVRDIQLLVTNQKPSLNIGFFPFVPPRQLEQNCSNLVKTLGEKIGVNLRLKTSINYQNYSQKLQKKSFDLALIQPFDYPYYAHEAGYRPLVKNSDPLKAIIVVNTDSKYHSLKDLQESNIAFPPKTAAVSILGVKLLKTENLVPENNFSALYLPEHFSCLRKVQNGTADACVTAERALRVFSHNNSSNFRTIASSREIPHVLFVYHDRLPEQEQKKVQAALTDMALSEQGKKALKHCGLGHLSPAGVDEYLSLSSVGEK